MIIARYPWKLKSYKTIKLYIISMPFTHNYVTNTIQQARFQMLNQV
jgi:hypothetical protein